MEHNMQHALTHLFSDKLEKKKFIYGEKKLQIIAKHASVPILPIPM